LDIHTLESAVWITPDDIWSRRNTNRSLGFHEFITVYLPKAAVVSFVEIHAQA